MARKVILVVENDEKTTQLVASALKSRYQLLCVSHGEKAIALAERETLHLALISRDLPDLGGLQLLGKMAAQFPAVPLIFIAENVSKDFIVTAFRSGAKDFLEKPIAASTLLESVSRLVGAAEKDTPVSIFAAKLLHSLKGTKFFRFHFPWVSLKQWWRHVAAVTSHLSTRLFNSPTPILFNKNAGSLFNPALTSGQVEPLMVSNAEATPSNMMAPADEEEKMGLALRVYCLGRFQVFLNDKRINHWPCRKGRELFAYLAVNHNKRAHREILMDSFWPESSPDSARNSLNVALHGIRTQLRELDLAHEIILYDDECYFFNPEIEMWLDVEAFQGHWRTAQRAELEKRHGDAVANYERAAALYQGEFLEDDLYESWPTQQRENLKEIYLVILDRLGEHYALDGHPDTAINLCDKILEKDICREDVYRRLMRCYYRLGQRDKALRVFKKCTEALKKELETEPARATIQLYEQVKQDCLKKT